MAQFGLYQKRAGVRSPWTPPLDARLVRKGTSHKPLKVVPAKKSFPSLCTIDTTCFDECFLLHVITERHYFLYKFLVTQMFGRTSILLHFLKQVF